MADKPTGGPTVLLYRGRQFPLDTKDVEKAYDEQKKKEAEAKGKAEPGRMVWPESQIPGVSGSGEAQPAGGVLNDEKSAAKASKAPEKASK